MTIDDATKRARAIWGTARTIDAVYKRDDGDGFDVALNTVAPPAGQTEAMAAGATPARHAWYHKLDNDGRAVCHADCSNLDKAAKR